MCYVITNFNFNYLFRTLCTQTEGKKTEEGKKIEIHIRQRLT